MERGPHPEGEGARQEHMSRGFRQQHGGEPLCQKLKSSSSLGSYKRPVDVEYSFVDHVKQEGPL